MCFLCDVNTYYLFKSPNNGQLQSSPLYLITHPHTIKQNDSEGGLLLARERPLDVDIRDRSSMAKYHMALKEVKRPSR